MDNLGAYDSDESGEEQEGQSTSAPPPSAAAAAPSKMLSSLPAPSAGTKPRRVFELPLPKPKGAAAAQKPDDDSDSDDDKFLKNTKKKGSGLLSFLPAPKNTFGQAKDTVSATTTNDNAYEEALKKKKQNPARLANSLFDKQLQQKRQEEQKKHEAERASREDTGDHVADSGEGDSQNEPSVTAPHDTGASSVTDAYPDTTASYQGEPAQQQLHLPDGWGAQWDEAAQAYYYYNGQGQTQWEAPAGSYMGPPAAAAGAGAPEDDMPEELKRELKKQKRSAAMRGEPIPSEIPAYVAASAKTIAQAQLFEGEKHRDYHSAAAAYHTPMSTGGLSGPTTLAKRKHQITDVLHNAALNELKYLDAAATGRKTKNQVASRYGW